jgi:hypothetical protein
MKAPDKKPVHVPSDAAVQAYTTAITKAEQGGNPFKEGACVFLYTDTDGENYMLVINKGREQLIKADQNNVLWYLKENAVDWSEKAVIPVPEFGKWFHIVVDPDAKSRKAAKSTFKGAQATPVMFANDKQYYVADGQPAYKYEACE